MALSRKVKRETALNPVARAVAWRLLTSKVNTLSLNLHLKPDGAVMVQDVMDASELMAIVMRALEMAGRREEPDYRVMRGALSALVEVSMDKFRWKTRHAVPVDEGVRRALLVARTLTAVQVKEAWSAIQAGG